MSFFHIEPPPHKKRRTSYQRQDTDMMTRSMNRVIREYVNRYNKEADYFRVNKHSVIENIALIINPFMTNILRKYSEADFHRVMSQTYVDEDGRRCWGFDFLGDWSRNHKFAWSIAMALARSWKNKLRFDVEIASSLVFDIMNSWNWNVSPTERAAVKHMLYRVRRTIERA
jgi:hypothetical protein